MRFKSRCGGARDRGQRDLQHAHVLLLRDHLDRVLRVARRDQHFEELRGDRLERRRVDGRSNAMMPPNADTGSVANAFR